MTVAHALIGFIIGQIITLEGFRLERLLVYVVSLFLVGLFIIFPALSLLSLVYSLQVQYNPVMVLCITMIMSEGLWRLLRFMEVPCEPHPY